jgi:hypothetical protein
MGDAGKESTRLREDQVARDMVANPVNDVQREADNESQTLSAEMHERWMQQVATQPADFLRLKFAAQAGAK